MPGGVARVTPFREGVATIDYRSRVQPRDGPQCAWGGSKVITATSFRRLACTGAVSLLVRVPSREVGLGRTSRRKAYRN